MRCTPHLAISSGHTCAVCEKNNPPEERTLGKVSFQSTKPGDDMASHGLEQHGAAPRRGMLRSRVCQSNPRGALIMIVILIRMIISIAIETATVITVTITILLIIIS